MLGNSRAAVVIVERYVWAHSDAGERNLAYVKKDEMKQV